MTESATPRIESQDLSVGALFKDFYSRSRLPARIRLAA